MTKEKATFNQLVSGAVLKFGKVDSVDVTLLMYGINEESFIVSSECELESDYFVMADGSLMLDEGYTRNVNMMINNSLLERKQGDVVKRYLNNLNIEEFVLRKIKFLGDGCVTTDDLINSFSIVQINALKGLYKERYIMNYIHKDSEYGDYEAIKLTKRGELYLFLIDYKSEVEEFVRMLKAKGYNSLLLEAYLITQKLSRSSLEILTLENFLNFCDEYGFDPRMNKYSKIKVPKKKQG